MRAESTAKEKKPLISAPERLSRTSLALGSNIFRRGVSALGTMMKVRTTLLATSICFLFLAGAGEAQEIPRSSDAASQQAKAHQKLPASKHGKTAEQKNRAPVREGRPCPRATWKDDPVCFDAPDEHTLPTPSSGSATAAKRDTDLRFRAPGDDNLSVGLKWGASNNPTQHGYDSIPMVNSVKPTQGEKDDWGGNGPDNRVGAGFDLKFGRPFA
jgi:hypothetical protein